VDPPFLENPVDRPSLELRVDPSVQVFQSLRRGLFSLSRRKGRGLRLGRVLQACLECRWLRPLRVFPDNRDILVCRVCLVCLVGPGLLAVPCCRLFQVYLHR